jgi:hypothetical protein
MIQADLKKWKEPVGRLEFLQVTGPEARQVCLLFLTPRCRRRLSGVDSRLNTSNGYSRKPKPVREQDNLVPFCVERDYTQPI